MTTCCITGRFREVMEGGDGDAEGDSTFKMRLLRAKII